ncbi:MAG: efflux RND transporter periplasmic adaptor subunit [Chitinophagaceae bacterium]|nr:MAG: efflux RND transporter periplasmic adaptor subunit [Chitinophagaceae bacterium]
MSTFFFACKEDKTKTAQLPAAPKGNAAIQAEGFIVKEKSLSENIEVPGSLLPFEETQIRPEISGRLVQLNIPEGNFVKKGYLLAKLFDGDLQAQLRKLQVQLEIATKTAERQKELLSINGISQQEYDLSELSINNLKADIELVRVSIVKTEIRAPYDGRIGLKAISLGAYITPTDIITSIVQVKELKLEFTIPEKYSDGMRKGQTVGFTVSGNSQKFSSTVLATETSIEATTRTLRVRAVVKGNNPSLVPGNFAKISLAMGKDENALIVPTQSIIPQARNKNAVVYSGGIAKFVPVVTGIRDSSYIQIVDGLKTGDTVIITGLLAIRPDSKVTLTKVQ